MPHLPRAQCPWLVSALALLGACEKPPPSDAAQPALARVPESAPPFAPRPGDSHGADPSSPAPWFVDEGAERGLVRRHESGARGSFYIPEITTGGVSLIDFDSDGDLDVYLVQGNLIDRDPDPAITNRLYENDGRGTFTDRTEGSGLDDSGYGFSASTGDWDGDGDTDLFLCNLGTSRLFRNEGDGRFTDVSRECGVVVEGFATTSAMVDDDGDGDLDLFVVRYLEWSPSIEQPCFTDRGERDYCNPRAYRAPATSLLFRNDGRGFFTDVSWESGVGSKPGTGLGVLCADLTGDGRTDLFVANDGMFNHLWVNQADGTYREEAATRGCASDDSGAAKAGMGVDAADLDDDGDYELVVCNLVRETDSLYRNDGAFFVDVTAAAGLAARSRAYTRWGVALIDFDADGAVDLFEATGRVLQQADRYRDDDVYAEPNLLFRGMTGAGIRFTEVEPRGGTSPPVIRSARGAATGDLDGDGAPDVLVVNQNASPTLLRNVAPRPGSFAVLSVLERTGAAALGADLFVKLSTGKTRRYLVHTARSFGAASDPRVFVGLPAGTIISSIRVRWTDGMEQEFAGDQRVLRRARSEE